jgi:hypothetical protein
MGYGTISASRRTSVRHHAGRLSGTLRGGFQAGNLYGVLVPEIEEHPVVAAAEPEASQWRLELFHVAVAVGQVAVYTVKNLQGSFAVDGAQIGTGLATR